MRAHVHDVAKQLGTSELQPHKPQLCAYRPRPDSASKIYYNCQPQCVGDIASSLHLCFDALVANCQSKITDNRELNPFRVEPVKS